MFKTTTSRKTAWGKRICGASKEIVWLLVAYLAASASVASPATKLDHAIRSILRRKSLRKAVVALKVVNLESGAVYAETKPHRPMIPASNQKLITSTAALGILGPQYKFKTVIGYTGRIEEDELLGDLFFVGGGDPNISGRFFKGQVSALFDHWAKKLYAKGIRRISGDIVGDDGFFDREFVHPEWPADQLSRSYCAPVAALSGNDNCVSLKVMPASVAGSPATILAAPETALFNTINSCRTSGRRVVIHIEQASKNNGKFTIAVKGSIPAAVAEWSTEMPVKDPPLFTAAMLEAALKRAGIALGGHCRRVTGDDAEKEVHSLIAFRSGMERTLNVMNRESQNFYAEQLFKTISAHKTGKGTWRSSAEIVENWAAAAGVRREEISVSDGSGMSRKNRVSAEAIVHLLRHAQTAGYGELLKNSLAVAGESGTLKKRLAKAPYMGNVRAKTGYLRGVGALSGYARTRSSKNVVFCVLINDFNGWGGVKFVLDDVAKAVIDNI